jgi:uncharacterized membrane protein
LVAKAFIYRHHKCGFIEVNKMSNNAESSKNLAGIGSILLIFPFLSIVGIILVFIGMKGLSDYYKEPSIYQNALWGLIFGIIAGVAVAAAVPLIFIGGLFGGALGLGVGLLSLFGVLVVVFVFYVIAAMYLRRAFSALAQKTGEHAFESAGNLLWIGALLTIVFGIGLILIFIAWIFATIGFFSMKPSPQPTVYTPPSTTAAPLPTTQATRYCPNCGAPVQPNVAFCPNCGKQLPT